MGMNNDIVSDSGPWSNDCEFIYAKVSANVGGLYDGMRAYFGHINNCYQDSLLSDCYKILFFQYVIGVLLGQASICNYAADFSAPNLSVVHHKTRVTHNSR